MFIDRYPQKTDKNYKYLLLNRENLLFALVIKKNKIFNKHYEHNYD